MTNLERWKDKIQQVSKISNSGTIFAIVNGKPERCAGTSCEQCERNHKCTEFNLVEWLAAEYKEPEVDWSNIKIDTPILVSSDGFRWKRRYFARYDNGMVCAWVCGCTSWTVIDETDECCSSRTWNFAKLAEDE